MSETMKSQRLDVENASEFAELLRGLLDGKKFALLENNALGLKLTTGLALEPAPAWGSPVSVTKHDDGSRAVFCLNHSDGMLVMSVPSRANEGRPVPQFVRFDKGLSVNHLSDAGQPITWTFFVEA